jgi:DNA-binding winged helix-turn-helix (wHTH) protein
LNSVHCVTPVINVVTKDPILSHKVSSFAKQNSNYSVIASPQPNLPYGKVDVYVIPVEEIDSLFSSAAEEWDNKGRLPLIGYGKVQHLEYAFLRGCLDYLKEPWTLKELILRANKIVEKNKLVFDWGTIRFSPTGLWTQHRYQGLTYHEYIILKLLSLHCGEIVPREAMYYAICGKESTDSRAVDMHISRLRRKFQHLQPPPGNSPIIRTVRGWGYYIEG